MSYLVLARKWRPQRFQDVIGQDHVVHTLQNAVNKDRLAHAFVFTGARGVGKTTAARLLAKALQCAEGPTAEPCGSCQICVDIAESHCVDVLEIDGASNRGIDQVRELREGVRYLPQTARFKIVIIDEVHMLTTEAFNALLKTLEEPPSHVKFIFATTEPHRIPITILSRCQRFDFKRIAPGPVADYLKKIADAEEVEVEEEALHQVARAAQGSMRDALSLFDQAIAYSDGVITSQVASDALGIIDRRVVVQLTEAILGMQPDLALQGVLQAYQSGYDMRQLLGELIEELRHLVVASAVASPSALIDLPEREIELVAERAKAVADEDLQRLFAMALDHVDVVARADSPRLVLDVLVARMAAMPPYQSLDQLSALLQQLESASPVASGGRPAARRPAQRPAAQRPAAQRPAAQRPAAQSSAAQRPAAQRPAAQSPTQATPAPAKPAAKPASPGAKPAGTAKVGAKPEVEAAAAKNPVPATNRQATASKPDTDPAVAEPPAEEAEEPRAFPGVDQRWLAVVSEVRAQHPALASFLEHGVVVANASETLTVRFEQSFYADAVKDGDNLKHTTDAVRKNYQDTRLVRVEVGTVERDAEQSMAEIEAQKRREQSANREAEALESPTVKAAVEIFGGTVVQIKEV